MASPTTTRRPRPFDVRALLRHATRLELGAVCVGAALLAVVAVTFIFALLQLIPIFQDVAFPFGMTAFLASLGAAILAFVLVRVWARSLASPTNK